MKDQIPERDWKYLRSIQAELLEELSRRSNDAIKKIFDRHGVSEMEKRQLVYDSVHKFDKVVASCFDDWRRSTILERCWALQKHKLLKPEHVEHLDSMTQSWISMVP